MRLFFIVYGILLFIIGIWSLFLYQFEQPQTPVLLIIFWVFVFVSIVSIAIGFLLRDY